jgi:hypothetical protein
MTMKTKASSGLKVTSGIKAGGLAVCNHVRSGLRVKAGIKAGTVVGVFQANHNARLLTVG